MDLSVTVKKKIANEHNISSF